MEESGGAGSKSLVHSVKSVNYSVKSANYSERSANYSVKSMDPSSKSTETVTTVTTVITNSGDWKTPLADESFVSICINPWQLFLLFRRARIFTIEPIIFLYMYGTFLYFPILQQYVFWRFGKMELSNTTFPFPNGSFCLNSTQLDDYGGNGTSRKVETLSNHLGLLTSFANRLPSVVVTLFILGPLSDRFGRKPIIYFVAAGAILQVVLTILFIHYDANPLLLLVSEFCAGITGGFAAILTSCLSYVADVGSLKWRTVRIAIAESMVFLAGAIAQGTGGIWLDKVNCNFVTPLWLALACNAGIILYTFIYLPESLTRTERNMYNKNGPKGFAMALKGFKIMFSGQKKYSVWKLWVAIIPIAIYVLNSTGSQTLTVFFFKSADFQWNATLIGAYQATSQTTHGLSLLVLVPVLVLLKFPDPLIVLIGLAFSGSMSIFFGFAKKTYEFFIISVLQGVEAIIAPPIRGMMSKIVPPEDQGALFSFVASTEVLASLIAGIVYPIIFPATINHGLSPGTAFLVMAASCILPVPLVVLLLIFRKNRTDANESTASQDIEPSERDRLLADQSNTSSYLSEQPLTGSIN